MTVCVAIFNKVRIAEQALFFILLVSFYAIV